MEILNKTKPKKPKFVRTPHPTFSYNERKQRDIYWGQEVERWHTGYNGLTGLHYFHLQNMPLKDPLGVPIFGIWREDDEECVFKPIQKCIEDNSDFAFFKRREAAWSSTCGSLALYYAFTRPGSTVLYTSADDPRITEFYTSKLLFAYERLEGFSGIPMQLLNITYPPDNRPKNNKSNHILTLKNGSIVLGLSTNPDPTTVEAYRISCGIIDEIGLHPHTNKVKSSMNASRMSSLSRIGPIFMGGSCGDMTSDAAKTLPKMVKDSVNQRLVVSFYLGYHGVRDMDMPEETKNGEIIYKPTKIMENGYSNHELAKQCIIKTREILSLATDQEEYWKYYKHFPLYESEIFEAIDESTLPEDIKKRLSAQEQLILRNEGVEKFGYLTDNNGPIEFIEKKSASLCIVKPPIPNRKYIAGIDPIPFADNDKDKGSDMVIAIKDIDMDEYVAYMAERTDDPNILVDKCIMLQTYYNNAQAMIEMEQGGVVFQKYVEKECKHLLSNSPDSLGIKYVKTEQHIGYRASKLGDKANGFFLSYLKNGGIEKIYMIRAIREAKQYGTGKNLDLKDAMRGCELLQANIIAKTKKEESRKKNEKIQILTVENGKYVYKELQVGSHLINK